MFHDVSAQVILHTGLIPHRRGQQSLHPAGIGLPSVLGNRPAVGPGQACQQATHERPHPAAWLDPGEPRTDPHHQLGELQLPLVKVYAGGSSHRPISLSLHKPG